MVKRNSEFQIYLVIVALLLSLSISICACQVQDSVTATPTAKSIVTPYKVTQTVEPTATTYVISEADITFDSLCYFSKDDFGEIDESYLLGLFSETEVTYEVQSNPLSFQTDVRVYSWMEPTAFTQSKLKAEFYKGHLYRITHQLENGPTFDSIINKFGLPDSVDRWAVIEGRSNPYSYGIGILYNQKYELTIWSHGQKETHDELVHNGEYALFLSGDLKVDMITCVTQTVFNDMLSHAPSDIREAIVSYDTLPWSGIDIWVPIMNE